MFFVSLQEDRAIKILIVMEFDKSNMIMDHDLRRLNSKGTEEMVAHILCYRGTFDFTFDDRPFTLSPHTAMIVRIQKLLDNKKASDDQAVRCVYIKVPYLEYCSPKNNYGIKGSLSLYRNPVMRLTDKQFELLDMDYRCLEFRYGNDGHRFQDDIIYCCTQTLFLDFFDARASECDDDKDVVSEQTASVIGRFFQLLNEGNYVKHREVTWYADRLFVTSKYLSEVCKNVSGKAANYWINRYATIHIRRLLRERDLTFTQIADMFEFSSPAYFSRFVQKNLGTSPSEFRQ